MTDLEDQVLELRREARANRDYMVDTRKQVEVARDRHQSLIKLLGIAGRSMVDASVEIGK